MPLADGEPAGAVETGDARVDPEEVTALLDHLFVHTGMDFRRYAQRAVERRLRHIMLQEGVARVRDLRTRLTNDADATRLAERMCVKVTTLFRDPPFWVALRARIAPALRERPFVRVWIAGCASGEEAWSMAMLLAEEGLHDRSRIYATDVDETALERARAGVYPLEDMREYTHNYQRAGGAAAFSEYYTVGGGGAALRPFLRRNIVFSRHNLATDGSFNAFDLVLCRNVLIYFEPSLQEHVHALLRRSLAPGGVVALGQREVVPGALAAAYEELDAAYKLYRVRPERAPR
jgi:chemotaxis protein methyltransferase CheR